MIPSPQQAESKEKQRLSFAEASNWLTAQCRCIMPTLATFLCFFLLPFIRWVQIPSPFAAAFLPARKEKPTFFVLLGLVLSLVLRLCWGLKADVWQYIGCGLVWLALRVYIPKTAVQASLYCLFALLPRVAAACVFGTIWDMILAVAALPIGMLAAFVLRNGFEDWADCYAQPRVRERFGVQILCLLLMGALGFFRIGSVNLGCLCALVATLLAAVVNGPAYGTAAGLFCGLSLMMSGHGDRLIFPLCLCGLLGGSSPIAHRRILLAPLVPLVCLLTAGLTPTNRLSIPWVTALLAGLLIAAAPRKLMELAQLYLSGTLPGESRMQNDFVSQRIAHIRDTVHKIVHTLPKPAACTLKDGEALGALLCAQCSNRELCWGRSRRDTEHMLALSMDRVRDGHHVCESELPLLERHGCLRADEIDQTAQQALIAQKKRQHKLSRAEYEQALTVTHLTAMSGALHELSALAAGQSVGDLQAAHQIRLAIDELRLPAQLCYARRVDGHLQVALQTEGLRTSRKAIDSLLRYLDEAEDMQLTICRMEHGHVDLEETPVYYAAIGTASLSALQDTTDSEAICGDACVAKRCDGGRMLMVLCDGMGHGEQAHTKSQKALELLLLLLEAGYTRRQAITAVNGIMLNASPDEDSYTTVDLCDVDLWNGAVTCEKLGACATWVLRGEHLKKVEAASLPLGILEEAIPCHAEYTLHSGDILIMMSDGVVDAFRDEEELKHAILESVFIQPQRMADALLRTALLAGGDHPRDDMTVMVLLLLNRQQVATGNRR